MIPIFKRLKAAEPLYAGLLSSRHDLFTNGHIVSYNSILFHLLIFNSKKRGHSSVTPKQCAPFPAFEVLSFCSFYFPLTWPLIFVAFTKSQETAPSFP